MIAYSPTAETFFGRLSRVEVGFSDAAARLRRGIDESLEHYLKPRLDQLVPEIEEVVVSSHTVGYLGIPVDQETADMGVEFASRLPRFAPIPEISPDPDGEISFDWIQASGRMFSVSVNKSGRLAYAGWFGENSRVHGIEKLADRLPKAIADGLERAVRR
jgi:hypothetical protein